MLDEVGVPGAADIGETLLVGAHPKVLDFVLGVPESGWHHAPGEGTGHRHRENEHQFLRVDERGIAFDHGGGRPSFPAHLLAAVLAHPSGARTVISRDGLAMEVDPREWEDGKGAVAEVDAVAGPLLLPQLTDPDVGPAPRLLWMPGPRTLVSLMVAAFLLLVAVIVGAAGVIVRARAKGRRPTPR